MRKLGIRSIVVKKYNYAGTKRVDDTNKPNLLEQNFKARKPKEKWVGDITYIYTKEIGWTYLAIVMDLYDLKIIGYSYGKHMTANLVIQALNNAVCNVVIERSAIYFEEERINTLEISGEIMLTVLSAMAQQESENISSHVLLGLKMKKDRGELIGYNGCYGYNYNFETIFSIVDFVLQKIDLEKCMNDAENLKKEKSINIEDQYINEIKL